MLTHIRNIWLTLWAAPRGERFLLIVMSVFALLDLLAGNLIYAAIEAGVVVACIFMSYRDMLWFADNEDDITLEDIVELMEGNDYAKGIVTQEILKAGRAEPSVHAVGDKAMATIKASLIEGRVDQ